MDESIFPVNLVGFDKNPQIVPLVYNPNANTDNIHNILLIDSSVSEAHQFYDSANANTFPIMYSYSSEKTELLNLLRQKFQQGIKRVAFVFHDPIVIKKAFLDNTVFFNDSDLETNQTIFSENVIFLKDLVQEFSIENYDFLACNTLQYSIWKQYYELLQRLSSVKCGASNDATGNIQSGADWIMENTNEDIKHIYFTDSINNYASTLEATRISSDGGTIYIQYVSGTGLQYSNDQISWTSIGIDYPINIENTGGSLENILTVRFETDLIIDNPSEYFVCASSYITFDGSRSGVANGTVTFSDVANYPGLIQNGTSVTDGYHTITVQNIQTALTGTTNLAPGGGWLCQSYFGYNIKNIPDFDANFDYININNCINTCEIISLNSGGISGLFTSYNGVIQFSICSNSGIITGGQSGGICGGAPGSNNGEITITNCTNSGEIAGEYSGGISSAACGYSNGTANIVSCSNSGIITGGNAGGITGSVPGYTNGTATISNCINNGNIESSYGGGICGLSAGYTGGIVTISNCTNNGWFYNSYCGGICGAQAGENNGNVTITNCENTSNLVYNSTGGICGSFTAYDNGTVTVSNCLNSGAVSGSGSGGICADRSGMTNGKVTITNCANIGNVSGLRSGGIAGDRFGYNTNEECSITDSYCTSNITGSNAGGICGPEVGRTNDELYTPIVTIENCYSLGIIEESCGGILGGTLDGITYAATPIVTLTNCYTNGEVTDPDSGLISINLQIDDSVIVTNCYVGDANWSDTDANNVLTGTPTSLTSGNPGLTWTSTATDTPYVLSSFNSQLYDSNSVVTTTDYYTTSQGLIQSGYTYSIVNSNKLPRSIITINASNGIINFQNIKFNATPIVTNVIASKYDSYGNPYNYNVNTFTLTYGICFKEDSEILCLVNNEEKYVKVQDLKPNMLVKTCDETYVPIDTIGWFHLVNEIFNETNRHPDGLYELTKEIYPELTKNLVLTGRHSILVDTLKNQPLNEYKFARHIKIYNKYKLPCVANENAKPYKNGTFKIWSFCLQAEDEKKNYGIYANGLLVESTNKMAMKNITLNLVE